MSKVLISFLGTGAIEKHEYTEATYQFTSGNRYTTPFIATAIKQECDIDRVILIGTARSMWDCVYDYFGNTNGDFDENIWEKLYENRLHADHTTPIGSIEYQQEVERALGNGSKIVITHYGLNDEEIAKNSEIILNIEELLEKDDKLIIDITHSFRSLPMYMMNLLIFLKEVSDKRIKISHIYYGMLDATRELNYTPVVELNNLITVNDWITGAYSFKRFGNADKIAQLVRSINNNLSERLNSFSDAKNLNYIKELESQCRNLNRLLEGADSSPLSKRIIIPVVQDFVSRLTIDSDSPYPHSDFQFKLAMWQRNNHYYLAAYTTLTEAIITRYMEKHNETDHLFDRIRRDSVKENLDGGYTLYWEVSRTRNALVHCTDNVKGTPKQLIEKLSSFIDRYRNID